jgi:hypothetical protein
MMRGLSTRNYGAVVKEFREALRGGEVGGERQLHRGQTSCQGLRSLSQGMLCGPHVGGSKHSLHVSVASGSLAGPDGTS